MNIIVLSVVAVFPFLSTAANGPNDILNHVKPLKQISAAGRGVMFGVTDKGEIYRWTGKGWQLMEGQLTQIAVGVKNSQPEVWGVNSVNNSIWRATATGWVRMPGEARAVAVSKDGEVILALSVNGTPYQWNGSVWVQMPTSVPLKQVAVGKRDVIYGLNEAGQPLRWRANLNKWVAFKSKPLRSISSGIDGSLGAVDTENTGMVRKGEDVEAELNGSTAPPGYFFIPAPVNNLEILDSNVQIALDNRGLVGQFGTPWVQSALGSTMIPIDATLKVSTDTSFFEPEIKLVTKAGPPPPTIVNGCVLLSGTLKLDLGVESSLNPSPAGQAVTFTTKPLSDPAGTEVRFLDGSALLGTAKTDQSLRATLSVSSLSAGQHTITAASNGASKWQATITQTAGANASTSSTIDPSKFNCKAGQFASVVTIFEQVENYPQRVQPLQELFNFTGAGSASAGNTMVGYATEASAKPILCNPREFVNMSAHSWVRFELPAGFDGQQILIPAGSYNNYVVPACNRVWWDTLVFSCTNFTKSWSLIAGKYDADWTCSSSAGSSPYVKIGTR